MELKSHILNLAIAGICIVVLQGCQSNLAEQKHWMNRDTYSEEDIEEGVVYVSLEEYNKMTPEERRRMNAQLGWKSKLAGEGKKDSELQQRFEKMDEAFKELEKNEEL